VLPAKGLVYIFTGDGKGKTSAALGVAVRAVCAGLKVAWVAWYKEASWDIAEKRLPELVKIEMFFLGEGFYIQEARIKKQESRDNMRTASLKTGGVVIDKASEEAHRQAALAALEKTEELLKSQKYGLLVCDEINNAVHDRLIPLSTIRGIVQKRGKTHLILTGRNAAKEIIGMADLVTEMKKVKHPYDKKIPAQKGLDF
jgi:cob(I)alamin adenosyltransferase